MVSTAHTIMGPILLHLPLLLLLMCGIHALRLDDYTPRNGPISGGTLVHVQGEGFVTTGLRRSKCRFLENGRGSVLSAYNDVTNSSHMACRMPEIPFLTESELQNGHTLSLSIVNIGQSPSNTVPFTVYDLSTMSVTQISPREGLTNTSDIIISVSTQGVLDTSELTCSLADMRSETLVPATFINSSLIRCHPLLPFPETSGVQIEISLNGQSAANIPSLRNDITHFTFFSPPPDILSCQFTPSYALLLLSFDREVEIGSEDRSLGVLPFSELDCEVIFTYSALEVLGLDSQCYWLNSQQRQVVIQLTASTLVGLGTELTIRNDTIRTRYHQFSRLANGSVSISSISDPQLFRPMVVIEAPRVIPVCGNLTLSGARSQYGGVRPLEYQWVIGSEVYASSGRVIQDPSLVGYLPVGFMERSMLQIPVDAFNNDEPMSGSGSGMGITPVILPRNYSIQLSVRNFLGIISTARIDGITQAERPIPYLVIVGGTLRHLQSSSENTLQGMITSSNEGCPLNDSTIMYRWSVRDDSTNEIRFGAMINTNSSILVLPAGILRPNAIYTAVLSVRYGPRENDVVSDSVTIVTDVEVRALIKGGVRRALGVNHIITLDGRESGGVTMLPSNTTLITSWDCQVIASNDTCFEEDGEILSQRNNGELVYRIDAGRLAPGMEYQFSLTLALVWTDRNGTILESTAHQTVVIFPYSVPIVEICPSLGLDLNAVLVHRELTLLANVRTALPGNVTWTSEYVDGYGQLMLHQDLLKTPLNLTITQAEDIDTQPFVYSEYNPVLFTTLPNQLTLVLKENTLLPQNSYRIKLTAVDSLGQTGFAEIDIHTGSIPTSGHLEITPAEGRPLSTVFTLSAVGWTDDIGDTPLLYRFGLRYHYITVNTIAPTCCGENVSGNGSCVCEYWMNGISESDQLSTILPLPWTSDGDNTGVSVVAQIYDNKGALTEVVRELGPLVTQGNGTTESNTDTQLLQPMSEGSNEVVEISTVLSEIRRLLHDTGDWIQSLAHLSVAIATIESGISTNQTISLQLNLADLEQFWTTVMQLLFDIYDSYLPLSKSYLDIIVSLLHKSISQSSPSLTPPTIARVSRLLDNVVSVYNSFERGAAFSLAGLNERESFAILDIFEKLILSGSEVAERTANGQSSILRIRADENTASLLRILPRVGYGLCLQQALNEEMVFVHSSSSFLTLKSSLTHLPSDYRAGSSALVGAGENIIVNFRRDLFQQYLQWECAEGDGFCSGVCVSSAQYAHNILWQGSEYEPHTKTPILQLALVNSVNGLNLFLSSNGVFKRQAPDQNTRVEITFPITSPFSNQSNLACSHQQIEDGLWSDDGCSAQVVSSTSMVCRCLPELSATLLTVVERCPSGHYGDLCENMCPHGLWGSECLRSCDCLNGGQCSAVDGSCDCTPRWMGDRCEERCPVGRWGDGCSEACLCENGASCDPIDGSCDCTPGWIGTHCNTTCSEGFFGENCESPCQCRDITECTDKINGGCTCQAGFTGTTCEETCPSGFYGLGCASECECSTNGTRVCDPLNGLCDCLENWRGFFCETEVTTPPPTTAIPVPPYEIWWIVVGVLAVILIVAVLISVIVAIAVYIRKKKRSKVLPITEEAGPAGSSHDSWKKEVATTPGSSEGSELEMTRTRSLDVLIPQGKSLKDIFTPEKTATADAQDFKEPDKINDKLRWQVIRLKQQEKERGESAIPTSRGESRTDNKSTSNESSPAKSGIIETSMNDEEDDQVTEEIYKRGIYLTAESTLKHLRNAFIESKQIESKDKFFRFLRSDVPGDYIEIDTEDEVLLVQIETSLLQHRTLYIESIDSGSVEAELCVCGKYADMECTNCQRRGYCSSLCQQRDWLKHEPHCRSISERRRERKSSKKHRKKHRKHRDRKSSRASNLSSSRASNSSRKTPVGMLLLNEDICTCGKEAVFECSKCGKQGYCSKQCQEEDWNFHEYYCNQPGSNATSPRRTLTTPTKQTPMSAINSNQKLLTVQEEQDEEQTEQP